MDEQKGLLAVFTNWGDTLVSFILAAFFGMVRYLQDFLQKPRPPFERTILLIKATTAGATGLIIGWACREWEVGPNWAAFCIAVAGYGGAEFLDIFKEGIRDWFLRKAAAAANAPPKN